MAEHSKLPWQVDEDYPNCIQSSDDPNIEICECSIMVWDGHKMHTAGYGQDEVNAALIVRAVNSHDALVKALNGMVEMYADMVNSGDCGFWNPEEVKEVIASRAALSLASQQRCAESDTQSLETREVQS